MGRNALPCTQFLDDSMARYGRAQRRCCIPFRFRIGDI
jgi:hypothetical protein